MNDPIRNHAQEERNAINRAEWYRKWYPTRGTLHTSDHRTPEQAQRVEAMYARSRANFKAFKFAKLYGAKGNVTQIRPRRVTLIK
jgi:hypothetical protein